MQTAYDELQKDFNKIDSTDCNEFVDGIDTESVSYKFLNSLNQIRYDFQGQISIQKELNHAGALKESKFLQYLNKFQIQLPMLLFEKGF